MAYSKYKDALPQDTVSRIKEIYEELGLALDCSITEKVPGIFSATVTDRIGGWNTCGKGTTHDYCMASAYAESVEHLCSYMAYAVQPLTTQAKDHLGFSRYPDERIIAVAEIPQLAPDVFGDMVDAYCRMGESQLETSQVTAVWERYLGAKTTTVVPYYSVRRRQVVYLPDEVIGALCGTNGGGAGNTPVEAIGHGLDEISERYVKRQIYHQHLTPPTISRAYIRSVCPELEEIIDLLETQLHYKVVVKDASMGQGFTVICVLIIDQERQRYLANFGAHPRFEIALERCLTEMFQLYTPGNHGAMKRKDMAKWQSYDDGRIDEIRNWISLLRDDTGILPDSIFAGPPAWPWAPWPTQEDYSNRIGAQSQLQNLLRTTAADIYIRDISFLGFPVYRIYIPGVSTTSLALDNHQLNAFEQGQQMIDTLRREGRTALSPGELTQLLETVFASDSFVSALLFRNMNEAMLNAFRAALHFDLGERETAFDILRVQDDRLCWCALRDFQLQNAGVPVETRDELLELFFGTEEKEFAACWRDTQVFLALMNLFVVRTNRNLNGNSSKDIEQTSQLHMRLKAMMVNNIPDSAAIGTLFDLP